MEGIGFVATSSPAVPRTGRPSGSQDSTATPSGRQDISPAYTAVSGLAPMKAAQISVPPDVGASSRFGLTDVYTQPATSAASGEPEHWTSRSLLRSHVLAGWRPACAQAAR